PVIGDLSAPVGADDGDGAAAQNVFRLARLAKRVDGLVLDQPDFVRRIGAPFFGVALHGQPYLRIGSGPGQPLDGNHYSTIDTRGWPCRARYRPSSCSREVARTVKVRPM